MKAIYKAVLRDIYFHKGRSFITFFALFLVIAFPIAMFSTGASIENSINITNEEYHLAHMDLYFGPIHEDITTNITDTIIDTLGVSPERVQAQLNTKTKIFHEETWYSVQTFGVNPNKTLEINQVKIIEGKFDLKAGEIAVMDTFATHLNISIGDSLTLNLGSRNETYSIVGFIQAINYVSYDLVQQGFIYLNEADLRDLMGFPDQYFNEVLIYLSEDITDEEVEICSINLRDYFKENHIPVYFLWHTRIVSYGAVLSDTLNLTSSYLATSATLIVIIVGIVIFIITKRYAIEQRKQTGMLYSYGFSSKTIMSAFLLRTSVLSFFAMIFGSVAGWYLLKLLTSFLGNLWGLLNVSALITAGTVSEVLLSTFGVSLLFTFLAARENVSLTPYEAIRGKIKEFSQKMNLSVMVRFPIQLKVPIRNVSRNKVRSVLTVLAFSGSIMLSFSLINTQTNLTETQEDFFSTLNWDVQTIFNTHDYSDSIYLEMKENEEIITCEPFLERNVQFFEQVEKITIFRGILSNSTLIELDLQEGPGFSDEIKDEVILSQFNADNLGYSVGDNCSFWLFDQQINVTVVGIARTMDSPLLMYIQLETLEDIFGFMPINGMLVDVEDTEINDYTNVLNENSDVQFAIKKAKFETRIRNIVASQTVIVNIMVVLGLIVSFLSIFSTTIIIVIERDREYALQRVFGFSTWQILTQIFLELSFLVLIALLLGYLTGNYLSAYWKNLIAESFFSINNYFIWTDYLVLFLFALGATIFSLYPEYQTLKKQYLAEGIKEE
ncbi:ABC transporter permease [Promethearchaeum syntrophicum]|uniref:ABC transporter permease n=1 Tax=Promethearchaeum syntrophicum TaxID=2594042 RepID=A0A5B9D8D2_9ARCH|nr:FtsX-like permease family protein [Candidatus Prometheoarchaeum syntrophicum]QEE15261.1 FtsX-like permease family protein [Candidatus Prometheoarchaeum syntrophicum]